MIDAPRSAVPEGQVPCQSTPDLWFGYDGDELPHGRRTPRQQESVDRAKRLCVQECPAAAQQRCARQALKLGEGTGIWAGVELPISKLGSAARKAQLAIAREQLRVIAERCA